MFEVPKKRRYTWTSPGEINRYQIDYILTKSSSITLIKSYHSYPGAEIDSDHKLVVAKCCLKGSKHRRQRIRNKNQIKWNLQNLKNPEIKELFTKRTKENVKTIDYRNVWNSIKESILNAANATLKNETMRSG